MVSSVISETLRIAVTAAVEELSKSLEEIDGHLEPLSMGHFASVMRVLRIFQRSAAALTARVARPRNLRLPIHQLPYDVFLRVLQDAMECNVGGYHYDVSRYHEMAQVSVHWRAAILSSPSFWRVLKDDYHERMQDTVLRLNPTGPLIVWMAQNTKLQATKTFMAKVIPMSSRWQSLIFHRSYIDTLPDLLNTLPPTLKTISVTLVGGDISQNPVAIPDGDTLRHVRLEGLAIPWDSSRLNNLQTFALEGIRFNQPTIGQIVSLLSSSPHLRQLVLSRWDTRDSDAYKDEVEFKRYSGSLIPLHSLTTLVLQSIPEAITKFLLNQVQTTSLSYLLVVHTDPPSSGFGTPDFDFVEPASPFFDMVGQVLSQSCIGSTTIDYDDNQETVYVWTYGHLAKLYEVIHWTTGRPGLGIKFRARVGAPCGPAWRSLTRKMATHAPCVGFNFVGCNPPTMTWDAQEFSGRWGPAKFPLALFPHLPHIETIEFEKRFYPCPVLRFLATPRDRGRGMSWLCPGLDTILVWPDVYDDSDSDSDDRDDDRNHDKEYRIISKGVLDFIIQRYPMEMFEEEESYLGDCDGSGTSDDGGVEDEEDGNTATGDEDDSGDHGGVTSDGDDCSVSESSQISSTGSSCAYWHDMLVKLSLPSRVVQRLKKIDDVVLYEFIRDGVITTS